MSFEEITVLIAVIMLILCFIVVFVMIYNSKNLKAFPARISQCPDFYRYDVNSNKCKPLFSSSGSVSDVERLPLNPSLDEICKYKKNTLDKQSLLMDGITNRTLDCFDFI